MTIRTKPVALTPAELRDGLIAEFAPLGWGQGVVNPPLQGTRLCTVRARRERDSVMVYVARLGRHGGLSWTPWIGDARLVTAGARALQLLEDAQMRAHDLGAVELVDVSVVGGQIRALAA